jgi:hypothetical protein
MMVCHPQSGKETAHRPRIRECSAGGEGEGALAAHPAAVRTINARIHGQIFHVVISVTLL